MKLKFDLRILGAFLCVGITACGEPHTDSAAALSSSAMKLKFPFLSKKTGKKNTGTLGDQVPSSQVQQGQMQSHLGESPEPPKSPELLPEILEEGPSLHGGLSGENTNAGDKDLSTSSLYSLASESSYPAVAAEDAEVSSLAGSLEGDEIHSVLAERFVEDDVLKQSCENAGGSYRVSHRDCICPGETVFSYSATSHDGGSGACISLQAESLYERIPNYCLSTSGTPDLELCLAGEKLVLSVPRQMNYTFEKLSLPSFPSQKVMTTWVSTPSDLSKFFRAGLGLLALNQIQAPAEISFPHTGADGMGISLVYYEPDPSTIRKILEGEEDLKNTLFVPPPASSVSSELSNAIQFAISHLKEFAEPKMKRHSVLGCAELCIYSKLSEFSVDGRTYHLEWLKALASGGVYRNVIFVKSSSGLIEAQILLTPADTVSLVFVYRYEYPNREEISRNTLVFDRFANSVWQDLAKSDLPSQYGSFSWDKSGDIVVCESGFDIGKRAYDARITQSYLRGPEWRESFFGWVANGSGNPILNWSGLSSANYTPGLPYYFNKDHAFAVSKILAENGNRLIPIGVNECLYSSHLWTENVRNYGTRVVNLSSVFSYDSTVCAENAIGQTISASPFLWIVAAGNGRENVTKNLSRSCPSNLGPRENLVTVAASSGGQLANSTTYGHEVVDIAADGSHPTQYGVEPVTSYATPRVSLVAAKIAKKFPTLSIASMRLALLMSARVPTDYWGNMTFLDLRSGGFLDADKAMKAARLLEGNPSWIHGIATSLEYWEVSSFIQELHCKTGIHENLDQCRNEVRSRMDWYLEKGVIRYVY